MLGNNLQRATWGEPESEAALPCWCCMLVAETQTVSAICWNPEPTSTPQGQNPMALPFQHPMLAHSSVHETQTSTTHFIPHSPHLLPKGSSTKAQTYTNQSSHNNLRSPPIHTLPLRQHPGQKWMEPCCPALSQTQQGRAGMCSLPQTFHTSLLQKHGASTI